MDKVAGFNLGSSNGNPLTNILTAGLSAFTFDVHDGQKRVEVTGQRPTDTGSNSYSVGVKNAGGTTVVTGSGTIGNGIFKLLDYIPPVPQRGGGTGIGTAWPFGSGTFTLELSLSKGDEITVQYNS